jgi:hypothetical protein
VTCFFWGVAVAFFALWVGFLGVATFFGVGDFSLTEALSFGPFGFRVTFAMVLGVVFFFAVDLIKLFFPIKTPLKLQVI